MKHLFTLVFFSFYAWAVSAQEQGSFKLSASANRTSFQTKNYTNNGFPTSVPGRVIQGYGLALEYYIGDFVSFSYVLEFGNTSRGARYMRYPVGPQLAILPFIGTGYYGGSNAIYLAMLLAVTPEGVHFHLPIQENKFYIAPYISPLGMFREKLPNQAATPALGFSIGSKLEIFSKNFTFSPYAGVRTLYRVATGGFGIEAGLHIGLLLND